MFYPVICSKREIPPLLRVNWDAFVHINAFLDTQSISRLLQTHSILWKERQEVAKQLQNEFVVEIGVIFSYFPRCQHAQVSIEQRVSYLSWESIGSVRFEIKRRLLRLFQTLRVGAISSGLREKLSHLQNECSSALEFHRRIQGAEQIGDLKAKSNVLRDIALDLSKQNLFDEAFQVVQQAPHFYIKAKALSEIFKTYAALPDFDFERAAQRYGRRSQLLCPLIEVYVTNPDFNMEWALQIASQIEENDSKSQALLVIIKACFARRNFNLDRAMQIALQIPSSAHKSQASYKILSLYMRSSTCNFEKVFQMAEHIEGNTEFRGSKASALSQLIKAYIATPHFNVKKALRVAEKIDSLSRSKVLGEIFTAFVKQLNLSPSQRDQILGKIKNFNGWKCSEELLEIIKAYVAIPNFDPDQAVAIAMQMPVDVGVDPFDDPIAYYDRPEALYEIVKAYLATPHPNLERAREIASYIPSDPAEGGNWKSRAYALIPQR